MSRLGARKVVTLDAACSRQTKKEVERIVPGKLANFTILADDPITIPKRRSKDIAVWGTMQEGRVLPFP